MTEKIYHSPVGDLLLMADGGALLMCDWVKGQHFSRTKLRMLKHSSDTYRTEDADLISTTITQLDEYFAAERREFQLPLRPIGTEFQQLVWKALREIPYGTTLSYAGLAQRIGRPRSVRAVANAVGSNPLSIIVPCHRIIGSNGTLTGYAGHLLDTKRYLLLLEAEG